MYKIALQLDDRIAIRDTYNGYEIENLIGTDWVQNTWIEQTELPIMKRAVKIMKQGAV